MELHSLKAAEGSRKVRNRVVVVHHQVTVKHLDVDKKVKNLVQVVEYVLVLKVDKQNCSVACQNVVS